MKIHHKNILYELQKPWPCFAWANSMPGLAYGHTLQASTCCESGVVIAL